MLAEIDYESVGKIGSDSGSEDDDFDLNTTKKKSKMSVMESSSEADDFDLNTTSKNQKKVFKSAETIESESESFVGKENGETAEEANENENEEENEFSQLSQDSQNAKPLKRQKKPKESLKALLKETGALIRETSMVELPINVAKPKILSSILNEALATAAQSTEKGRQAQKALIEEKRRAQQSRLQQLLGPERLAQLAREKPKIGAEAGLSEEFIVAPGESLKLVNLPDARSGNSMPRKRTGFAAHLPRHTPASIDLLNEKLSEKIAAQSTKAAARISAQFAQEAAKARAIAAAAEKKRQLDLAEKERKLELKRQAASAGPKFKNAAEKPVKKMTAQTTLQPMRPKIIFSDDSEDEKQVIRVREEDPEFVDYDADLAEEGFVVDEATASELEDESTEAEFSEEETDEDLPCPEALKAELGKSPYALKDELEKSPDAFDALLSGKFSSVVSANLTKKSSHQEPLKVELVKAKRRSNFVDDEAEDEDEELDAEMFDEEAMERELLESKFIAEDDDDYEDEEGQADTRATFHKLQMQEESRMLDRITEKFAKKTPGEDFLDHLETKYNDDEYEEFEPEITKISVSTEMKLQKLAAVKSFNPAYLRQGGAVQKATREFLFPEEIKAAERRERAYFAQVDPAMPPQSHPSSDFYSSATDESAAEDFDKDDEEEQDEKAMYEEEGQDAVPAEIDLENDQVEASESLNSAMKSMNEISFDFSSFNSTTSTAPAKNILLPNNKQASAMVPKAKEAMKAKLAALQQTEEGPAPGAKVFKGFIGK